MMNIRIFNEGPSCSAVYGDSGDRRGQKNPHTRLAKTKQSEEEHHRVMSPGVYIHHFHRTELIRTLIGANERPEATIKTWLVIGQ